MTNLRNYRGIFLRYLGRDTAPVRFLIYLRAPVQDASTTQKFPRSLILYASEGNFYTFFFLASLSLFQDPRCKNSWLHVSSRKRLTVCVGNPARVTQQSHDSLWKDRMTTQNYSDTSGTYRRGLKLRETVLISLPAAPPQN